MILHLIWLLTGLAGHGAWYNFWSGFGSDLGEFAAIGVLWRKFNCHEPGCKRIGHLPHQGYHYCKKHHDLKKAAK